MNPSNRTICVLGVEARATRYALPYRTRYSTFAVPVVCWNPARNFKQAPLGIVPPGTTVEARTVSLPVRLVAEKASAMIIIARKRLPVFRVRSMYLQRCSRASSRRSLHQYRRRRRRSRNSWGGLFPEAYEVAATPRTVHILVAVQPSQFCPGVASVSKRRRRPRNWLEGLFPERTTLPRCRGQSRCSPLCNRANSVQAWHQYRKRRRR